MLIPAIPGRLHQAESQLPVGAVVAFAGAVGDTMTEATTAVEAWGWMCCDGRELDVPGYPELFAALGFRYGGNRSDRFKIPDYRGYFLRGRDGGSGNDPDLAQREPPEGGSGSGAETGSLQKDALQTHEHSYKAAATPATSSPSGSAAGSPGETPTRTENGPTSTLAPPGEVRVSQTETRPKNIYVDYLIKYTYGKRGAHHVPFQ